MAAVYPRAMWADETARVQLLSAYVRRTRAEARLLAAEVARVLFASQEAQEISSDAMLARLGVTIE